MKLKRHKIFIKKTLIFTYIDSDTISNRYREEFNKWMTGQTVPVIENCKNPVYAWDWERWYNYKRFKKPLRW